MDGIENVDIDDGAEIIELARALAHAPPPTRRRRFVTVSVRAFDADAAGGEEIVHRAICAVAAPDDEALHAKAADVVRTLASLKPRTPVDASLGALFTAMSAASLDALKIARLAGFDSMMGTVLLSHPRNYAAAPSNWPK
jgi:hypothetical protein